MQFYIYLFICQLNKIIPIKEINEIGNRNPKFCATPNKRLMCSHFLGFFLRRSQHPAAAEAATAARPPPLGLVA